MLPRYSQDETEGFTAPDPDSSGNGSGDPVGAERWAPYVQQLVIEFQEPLVPTAWLAPGRGWSDAMKFSAPTFVRPRKETPDGGVAVVPLAGAL